MWLPAQRWLKAVVVATALIFAGVAVYLYGLRFFVWIESDASVTVLLARKAIEARMLVVADWYYANGDVWVLAPHLLAIVPVALLGVGPLSLLVAVVTGFVLELVALAHVYARLGGARWVGLFATMVTLAAWSRAHAAYVYIQLGYGFQTVVFLVVFWLLAAAAERAAAWRWPVAGTLLALCAVQNPTRGFAFMVAPAIVAALWPWRGLAWRRRLAVIATVVVAWLVAAVVYGQVLQRFVSFSTPRGLLEFTVKDLDGIAGNLALLGRGLALLCGAMDDRTWPAVPGGLVMAGACALVAREVLAARAWTALRFVCVVIAAQLGGVLAPLVLGNLMLDPGSARYLMPSLLTVYGLAAVLAVRAIAEPGRAWRWLATGWLVLVPIAALAASPTARPPTPATNQWPSVRDLRQVREGLAKRGLTHGFSNVIAANIMNLTARGATMTCPIYFAHVLIPQRWLADTTCFTPGALPPWFYIIVDHDDQEEASLRATLPAPDERFAGGRTYDVLVYRTANVPLAWLQLPLADGDAMAFPLRLPATHLALHRREVVRDDRRLVATGTPGFVVYGPYIKLPAGRYELVWTGSGLDGPGELAFTVHADFGKDVLARAVMPAAAIGKERTVIARLPFTLDRARSLVEFTVSSTGGGRVALDEVVLEKR